MTSPTQQEESRLDHREEALRALDRHIPKASGSESTLLPDYGRALVHSQLAVADELKALRGELKSQGDYLERAIRECSGNG